MILNENLVLNVKKKASRRNQSIKKIKGITFSTNNCSCIEIYFTFFSISDLIETCVLFFIYISNETNKIIPSRRTPSHNKKTYLINKIFRLIKLRYIKNGIFCVYKNRERQIQAVGINQLDEIMPLIRTFSLRGPGCLSLKNLTRRQTKKGNIK